MPSQDKQRRGLPFLPENELDTPFLAEEIFVKDVEPELEARLAALEAESSFQNAFDQAQTSKNEHELEEELATDEWIPNLPRLDLLPCKLPYDCQEKLKGTSVAVVGGGLAGLMAALQLCRCGVKVTVFEARLQVGGRVQSNIKWSNSRIIEEGAELIGSFHTTWMRLAREYGLAYISRMDENLYEREGLAVKLRLLNKDKDLSMDEICDLRKKMNDVLWQISKEASNIQDPSRPWLQPRLRQFDCMSVAEALAIIYKVEPNGLLWKMFEHLLVNDEVAPLDKMNFLGLLCKVRAGQDVRFCGDDTDLKDCLPKGCLLKEPKECLQKERLMRYWNELEIFRCADGCETLAKMMAKEIQTMGSNISPKMAVTSIKLSTHGVEIESRSVIDEKRERLAGKPNPPTKDRPTKYDYVILAIPPSVWGRVNIKVNDQVVHPPRMDMNGAVKHFSDVKKRFWIKENPPAAPSGGSLTLGQIWEGTDNQTRIPDSKQGIVLSVFAGPILPGGLVPAQDQIEKELKRLYPNYTHNLNKSSFKNWPEEPFIKTGYASPAKRQIFEIGERLSRPFYDRLFFAGEHTHMAFFGYMEGALRSGERAANMLMQKKCGLYKELDPVTPPRCPPLMVASSAPTGTKAASEYETEVPLEKHSNTYYSEEVESPSLNRDLFAIGANNTGKALTEPEEYLQLMARRSTLRTPEGVEWSAGIEEPETFDEAEDGFADNLEDEALDHDDARYEDQATEKFDFGIMPLEEEKTAEDEFEDYAEAFYENIDHKLAEEIEHPFYEMEYDKDSTTVEEESEDEFSHDDLYYIQSYEDMQANEGLMPLIQGEISEIDRAIKKAKDQIQVHINLQAKYAADASKNPNYGTAARKEMKKYLGWSDELDFLESLKAAYEPQKGVPLGYKVHTANDPKKCKYVLYPVTKKHPFTGKSDPANSWRQSSTLEKFCTDEDYGSFCLGVSRAMAFRTIFGLDKPSYLDILKDLKNNILAAKASGDTDTEARLIISRIVSHKHDPGSLRQFNQDLAQRYGIKNTIVRAVSTSKTQTYAEAWNKALNALKQGAPVIADLKNVTPGWHWVMVRRSPLGELWANDPLPERRIRKISPSEFAGRFELIVDTKTSVPITPNRAEAYKK